MKILLNFFFGLIFSSNLQAKNFKATELIEGKSTTLMQPAIILVPMKFRLEIASTANLQTLNFKVFSENGKSATNKIRLSVLDIKTKSIRFIDIIPGTASLFPFKEKGSIAISPDMVGTGDAKNLFLEVSSDKSAVYSR